MGAALPRWTDEYVGPYAGVSGFTLSWLLSNCDNSGLFLLSEHLSEYDKSWQKFFDRTFSD